MKVALFFDGKNFYSGWREKASRQPLDFSALSRWLVRRVGGTLLWGAYYYTGIETGPGAGGTGQTALTSFLDNLEMLPGYFVQRFPRRSKSYHCRDCAAENYFTQENEVDTTMVADMLRLAAVGAFDILVLMSGDADHAPAVEGVRALGRQAFVATWGAVGLSRRIRRAAFDHIDLCESLAECGRLGSMAGVGQGVEWPAPEPMLVPPPGGVDDHPIVPAGNGLFPSLDSDAAADALVDEIRRAEAKFPTGYVGVNFFVTRWQASNLDPDPDVRRRLIDKVVREDRIELYTTEEGTKAIRVKRQSPPSTPPATPASSESIDSSGKLPK